MSATSVDQGTSGIDVDRTNQEAHEKVIPCVSTDFASSSVPDGESDSLARPSTAIKIPQDATQSATSTKKPKSSPEHFSKQQPPSPPKASKQTSKSSLKREHEQAPPSGSEASKQSSSSPPRQDPEQAPPSSSKAQKSLANLNQKPKANLKQPTPGPVLVNPGLPPSPSLSPSSPFTAPRTGIMHLPLSPHSLTHPHRSSSRSTRHQTRSLPVAPSPTSFSFSSILSSLASDPGTQSDIDAIAEICGRSRLSLANEYAAHREPVGAGPDAVHIGEEGETRPTGGDFNDPDGPNHGPQPHGLVLDTGGAAIYRALGGVGGGALETVDEAPTPLSEGSRHRIGDTYNSNSANASQSPTAASAASEDQCTGGAGAGDRWGFLDVWERGARMGTGRAAGRSVLGLSGMEVEAVGEGESFSSADTGMGGEELQDDISGKGASRAMRQLMRVAGG
ncbi:MAG: hypothetical protein LQ340_001784 [Diploschistes diacapsis]|nr:MAG: hypothetical protein LQ340_001784 [Diploschistes diacapsis]